MLIIFREYFMFEPLLTLCLKMTQRNKSLLQTFQNFEKVHWKENYLLSFISELRLSNFIENDFSTKFLCNIITLKAFFDCLI